MTSAEVRTEHVRDEQEPVVGCHCVLRCEIVYLIITVL